MKNKLHPGMKWSYRLASYFIFIILVPIFSVPAFFLFSGFFWAFFLFYIVLILILTEVYVKMAYNRWFYEFDDQGFKSECGVLFKRYSNVPYERIQNVNVTRGIIARMLGFSTVQIQTAGYSGARGAEGRIPAVDFKYAEEIRDFLMKKITSKRK